MVKAQTVDPVLMRVIFATLLASPLYVLVINMMILSFLSQTVPCGPFYSFSLSLSLFLSLFLSLSLLLYLSSSLFSLLIHVSE